jgi:hypothetical protein
VSIINDCRYSNRYRDTIFLLFIDQENRKIGTAPIIKMGAVPILVKDFSSNFVIIERIPDLFRCILACFISWRKVMIRGNLNKAVLYPPNTSAGMGI